MNRKNPGDFEKFVARQSKAVAVSEAKDALLASLAGIGLQRKPHSDCHP